MKHGYQTQIARQIGISSQHVCLIINGKRRPSWRLSKQLAEITGTEPVLWLEGTIEQIKAALEEGPQPQLQ
jgi:DNA-binding XRE family transcriptional regulator